MDLEFILCKVFDALVLSWREGRPRSSGPTHQGWRLWRARPSREWMTRVTPRRAVMPWNDIRRPTWSWPREHASHRLRRGGCKSRSRAQQNSGRGADSSRKRAKLPERRSLRDACNVASPLSVEKRNLLKSRFLRRAPGSSPYRERDGSRPGTGARSPATPRPPSPAISPVPRLDSEPVAESTL